MKVLLITTRDYPSESSDNLVEIASSLFDEFIGACQKDVLSEDDFKTLRKKAEDLAECKGFGNDDEKIKEIEQKKCHWATVGRLFWHLRADWTQKEDVFNERKKKGIPAFKLACGEELAIYILPCLGSAMEDERFLEFKPQYIKACIAAVYEMCEKDGIKEPFVYAMVHSRDVVDQKPSGLLKESEASEGICLKELEKDDNSRKSLAAKLKGICLKELAKNHRIYYFHHEAETDVGYDSVVMPATQGKSNELSVEIIDELFKTAEENLSWEQKMLKEMKSLNNDFVKG